MTVHAAPADLEKLADRLCAISREAFANPHTSVEWPREIPADGWCLSPELVSIYGTPAWDALDEAARKRLAFHECVSFFSINIHGEKALLEGLTRRLYARDLAPYAPYLHHFVDEENKHMLYFGTFCGRYAGKTYPDRKLAPASEAPSRTADLLFFLKVAIFEELVDSYNVKMAKDERLVPVVRRINELHHQDETRHLAFGRTLVERSFRALKAEWSAEELAATRAYAADYLRATWREYYNTDAYRDAGLAEPYRVQQAALASEVTRAHRRRMGNKCVGWLIDIGFFTEEPGT
jgi:hypothetical protein